MAEFILEACIRLGNRLTRTLAPERPPDGLLGVFLFFVLLVGVPALAVLWGYATGRLPAPSPYVD